jgi:hypothetical protein
VKPVVASNPGVVEAAKPSSEQRVQEILAQRATVSPVKPVVASNPGVVEAAKPSSEPRIQEILAQRATVGTGKSATISKSMGGADASRTNASMDLKSIENNMMFSISALGQANKSLVEVEKELHMLTTLFKAVLGVGVVGVVLVVGVILRLTQYI